jgi:hypothetical protein
MNGRNHRTRERKKEFSSVFVVSVNIKNEKKKRKEKIVSLPSMATAKQSLEKKNQMFRFQRRKKRTWFGGEIIVLGQSFIERFKSVVLQNIKPSTYI